MLLEGSTIRVKAVGIDAGYVDADDLDAQERMQGLISNAIPLGPSAIVDQF